MIDLRDLTPNQLKAYSNVISAYLANTKGEYEDPIYEVGYNETSGYIYIVTENNMTIAAPDYRPDDVKVYEEEYID